MNYYSQQIRMEQLIMMKNGKKLYEFKIFPYNIMSGPQTYLSIEDLVHGYR